MKAISIWNPFALLVAKGFKTFETRSWPAPASLIGKRIVIASTKSIRQEQRGYFSDPNFRNCYDRLGLPDCVTKLDNGYALGTVVIDSVERITEEFLEEVSFEEQQYGWWLPGGYAWRLVNPKEFAHPVPIKGAQGIYEWRGLDDTEERRQASDP